MREFLEKYKIELETIGPVHIGSGITLRKGEWILEWSDQQAIIVSTDKLFELLVRKRLLTEYEKFAFSAKGDLLRWMKDHEISKKERYAIAKYTLDTSGLDLKNNRIHDLTTTIKDPYGKPYIPGSSLKGALRNIILAEMINNSSYDGTSIKYVIENYTGNAKQLLAGDSIRLNQKFFYTKKISDKPNDAVNDIMSGLRVSDSNSVELEKLTLCQKVDAGIDGKTTDLPIVRECIIPGTKFEFDLTIDRTKTNLTVKYIEKAINNFLKAYNQLFLSNFHEEVNYESQVIYLGGGVGFPSKTVLNQLFQNERNRVKITADTLNKIYPNKHHEDIAKGVSPRVVKLTEIEGQLLQMGPCRLAISAV